MDSNLAALIGVALGWGLSEVGLFLRGRREDRRAMGRALAHVLEAQRQLYVVCELTDDEYLALPADQRRMFEAGIHEAITAVRANQSKFEDTIEAVAGIDPLLGAKLRAKGTFTSDKLLGQLATLKPSAAELSQLRVELTKGLAQLEALVNTLARAHGLRTWWRVHRRGSSEQHPATILKQLSAAGEKRRPTMR